MTVGAIVQSLVCGDQVFYVFEIPKDKVEFMDTLIEDLPSEASSLRSICFTSNTFTFTPEVHVEVQNRNR